MNICFGMSSLSFKLEDRGLALPNDVMYMCHSNHGILLTVEISDYKIIIVIIIS